MQGTRLVEPCEKNCIWNHKGMILSSNKNYKALFYMNSDLHYTSVPQLDEQTDILTHKDKILFQQNMFLTAQ